MCLCTSRVGGIVWDSGCDLLPTKTSRVGSVVREVSFFGWYMLPGVHHEAGEPFSLFYLGSYYFVVCEPYIVVHAEPSGVDFWAWFPPGPLSHSAGPISGRPTWRGGGRKPHVHGTLLASGCPGGWMDDQTPSFVA